MVTHNTVISFPAPFYTLATFLLTSLGLSLPPYPYFTKSTNTHADVTDPDPSSPARQDPDTVDIPFFTVTPARSFSPCHFIIYGGRKGRSSSFVPMNTLYDFLHLMADVSFFVRFELSGCEFSVFKHCFRPIQTQLNVDVIRKLNRVCKSVRTLRQIPIEGLP